MTPKTVPGADGKGLRVMVVDSTHLTGSLIAGALKRDRKLCVTNATVDSVLAKVATSPPHVVILSAILGGIPGRGFEVLTELRAAVPETRVVMLLDSAERELIVETFRRGARGAFCRSDSLLMLTRCVHRVHEGQLWISGYQLEYLLETLDGAPSTRLVNAQGAPLLSKREEDVTRCLAAGRTNREIARDLNITEKTAKAHVSGILGKPGPHSRTQAALYAREHLIS